MFNYVFPTQMDATNFNFISDIQEREKKLANLAKLQPGRDRQKS